MITCQLTGSVSLETLDEVNTFVGKLTPEVKRLFEEVGFKNPKIRVEVNGEPQE